MNVRYVALSLIAMAILAGCSSSAPVKTNHLSAEEISIELEEFRRLKPSLQRLAASETELKELIVTLDQLANVDNPDHQPDVNQQNKNTEVNVLDKNVFNENVVTPVSIEANAVRTVQVNRTPPGSKKTEQKIEPVVEATIKAVKTEAVTTVAEVSQTGPVIAEPKPEVAAVVSQHEVTPQVAETVKLQQRYALQLASVVNPNQLVSTWTQIQRRHSSILSGMEPLYEKFQKGKTTFYRLKAMGTLTVADARSACSSIVGQGGQCFIGSNSGVKNVTEL